MFVLVFAFAVCQMQMGKAPFAAVSGFFFYFNRSKKLTAAPSALDPANLITDMVLQFTFKFILNTQIKIVHPRETVQGNRIQISIRLLL